MLFVTVLGHYSKLTASKIIVTSIIMNERSVFSQKMTQKILKQPRQTNN